MHTYTLARHAKTIDLIFSVGCLYYLFSGYAILAEATAIGCAFISVMFFIGMCNTAFRQRVLAPQPPRLLNDGLSAILAVALFGTGHPWAGALLGAATLTIVLFQKPPRRYASC